MLDSVESVFGARSEVLFVVVRLVDGRCDGEVSGLAEGGDWTVEGMVGGIGLCVSVISTSGEDSKMLEQGSLI